MIEAVKLTKKFKSKVAVDNISFRVETGKVTGFLGPNGAGKSTTMRLMLGLDRGAGKTLFDGKPLTEYVRPSRVVGILLEAKAFHPTRAARNHLRVLADAGDIPPSRVEEVLEIVGLRDVAKGPPGKFSLGMAQRLGIAAALLGSPKYLILDEPANGLDPEGIAWLREFIKNYADDGNAVFVSSHLLSEMAQMADNVVVIGRGKLIADTSMSQLITDNTHGGVYVRTSSGQKLERILHQRLLKYKRVDGGFAVEGVKTDDIGRLAYEASVPILELSPKKASLEDAFLQMTSGAEEYKAEAADGRALANTTGKGAH
jgi:ABC-2 type transport system ATP-binding protein